MTAKINLLDLSPADAGEQLRQAFAEWREPPYRAAQALRALWINPVSDFSQITELPKSVRARLAETFEMPRLTLAMRQRSADGTEKFLFQLGDGEAVETVAIPEAGRMTICISSQAGCALQCAFCATGAMGFRRNLSVHEIAGQIRELRLLDPPLPVTNIVFMGMGEPMMNWRAVDSALTILNDPMGLGIGARHITVSTVGVLPGIIALGQRREQFRLAISIHAPSDALRRDLMPINVKYPLTDVIQAAREFDRRVTFEYVMLAGINDGPAEAAQLAALARAGGAFVNLIPLHPGGARGFAATPPAGIRAFARELRAAGVEVAIRKSRGIDIAAACGQLRIEGLGRRSPSGAQHNRDVHVG